jgi:uncharacterized protein DUF222
MQSASAPANAAEALSMLDAALDHLNATDWGSLPASVQRKALTGLGRAEAKQTAARTAALTAFDATSGYTADGHGGPVPWLTGATRVTKPAAREQAEWLRRLDRHPRIAAALAAGWLSPSWAKQFAAWNDRLPQEDRDDADEILLGAATAGLPLDDIAKLAQEMYERSTDQPDDDQPFRDRQVKLETTFGGAGKLTGDLSPECAAIVQKIFDSLGKNTGPEDLRTEGERNHDALEEALRRLIKSGMLPDSAGMDTRAMVTFPLSQLRQMPGASELENAWITARAGECGWLTGPGAQAAACDAEVTPVVTGTVDWQAADAMTQAWIDAHGLEHRASCGCTCGGCTCAPPTPIPAETRARLTRTLLRLAADALSGPAGLAGYLRTRLPGIGYSTASLPLDVGYSDKIPDHIRRAVILRDRHCAWPGGCDKPPAGCHIHHLIPKAQGGTTRLQGLVLLCGYHHQVCIHRLGWKLILHADGSTEAISPWGQILRSHGPPATQAA